MGTTANIILIKNNTLYLANVGDSLSVMYKNNKGGEWLWLIHMNHLKQCIQ